MESEAAGQAGDGVPGWRGNGALCSMLCEWGSGASISADELPEVLMCLGSQFDSTSGVLHVGVPGRRLHMWELFTVC
jgi:hypothetical protein